MSQVTIADKIDTTPSTTTKFVGGDFNALKAAINSKADIGSGGGGSANIAWGEKHTATGSATVTLNHVPIGAISASVGPGIMECVTTSGSAVVSFLDQDGTALTPDSGTKLLFSYNY